jgi:hypothetical protein
MCEKEREKSLRIREEREIENRREQVFDHIVPLAVFNYPLNLSHSVTLCHSVTIAEILFIQEFNVLVIF